MNELQIIVTIIVAVISFLIGRWAGIQAFDREMTKAGLLPPKEN